MTGLSTPDENIYLAGSLPALFAKTATPIIVVMGVNGLFTVVDAYFLGAYVGADALTKQLGAVAREHRRTPDPAADVDVEG